MARRPASERNQGGVQALTKRFQPPAALNPQRKGRVSSIVVLSTSAYRLFPKSIEPNGSASVGCASQSPR